MLVLEQHERVLALVEQALNPVDLVEGSRIYVLVVHVVVLIVRPQSGEGPGWNSRQHDERPPGGTSARG
ncbi:MAG: hypothetical protein M3P39_04905, partial [Actinomycetota bacterium]|nr:hypothetical protein [Actinomycetota bacterium]